MVIAIEVVNAYLKQDSALCHRMQVSNSESDSVEDIIEKIPGISAWEPNNNGEPDMLM